MEKIMMLAQLPPAIEADDFRDTKIPSLSQELLRRNDVHGLCVQIEDSDVAAAAQWRLDIAGQAPQCVISLWVDSANAFTAIESLVKNYFSSEGNTIVAVIESYLVSESEVLDPGFKAGARGTGSAQICTFRALPDLSTAEFIKRWRGQHTALAVDTQSNFGYRQNLVVAALNETSRPCSAIVEEHFPAAAMNSAEVFFDAQGDAEKLQLHQQKMAESCSRFIDFESINVVHMSEYVIKKLAL